MRRVATRRSAVATAVAAHSSEDFNSDDFFNNDFLAADASDDEELSTSLNSSGVVEPPVGNVERLRRQAVRIRQALRL